MKKWDFIKMVSERTGLTQQDVNKVVDELGNLIVSEVRDGGDEVFLPTLGTFRQKINAARKARNPKTGEQIEVKASRTVAFRPISSIRVVGK